MPSVLGTGCTSVKLGPSLDIPRASFYEGLAAGPNLSCRQLQPTGIAPITCANDPFWNMRAFDNALSRHDGYRLSSFICAVAQLVLDDTTSAVSPMTSRMEDPDRPTVNPIP